MSNLVVSIVQPTIETVTSSFNRMDQRVPSQYLPMQYLLMKGLTPMHRPVTFTEPTIFFILKSVMDDHPVYHADIYHFIRVNRFTILRPLCIPTPCNSTETTDPPSIEENSGYLHLGGDRSGAFLRESDRFHSTKQLLRRPSLSTISPDPRSFMSTRSLATGRSKKSTKKSKGRRQYAEMEESDPGYWTRSDPKPFQPQRSNSIYRKFDKNKKLDRHVDDDVWVERLILNDNGVKQTCFKSLRGNVTRKEPPTGASTIVYLEDIIVDNEGKPSRARPAENKEQAKKKKKKKKKKETRKQEPELQAEENSPQPEKTTLKELENAETQSSSTETEIEEKEKEKGKKKIRPRGLLKRRASIFGFMKKKKKSSTGKAKTGNADANE